LDIQVARSSGIHSRLTGRRKPPLRTYRFLSALHRLIVSTLQSARALALTHSIFSRTRLLSVI
jgi:hypothetical protein